MACCGRNKSQPIEYKIIYKGGEPEETVSTLREVREKLQNSSQGGYPVPVPKSK